MLYTYKVAFSVSVMGVIFNFLYLVLFGSMFATTNIPSLPAAYNGDFISYILVGSIGWGFLWSIMSGTGSSLRNEMVMGTLESVLLTPTKMFTLMFSYALFGSFFGFLSMIALTLIGFVFFGFSVFANANIFTLIIFILSAAMMMGFGMIFGGLTIWLKKIGETIPLLQSIVTFFSGVYFPLAVLPAFLQPIAKYIPFYYSIQGLRLSMIPSTPIYELIYYVSIILILAVVVNIIGFYTLKRGLLKAKKDGSLAFY